ncbi:MAG: phosphoenolpyruvate synthase [Hyphomicrobiaceae bacterium]
MSDVDLLRWFSEIGRADGDSVGGKNASIGEMIQNLSQVGIRVPAGFATTSEAYWSFIDTNDLRAPIRSTLDGLNDDLSNLADVGAHVRSFILNGELPEAVVDAVLDAYRGMMVNNKLPAVAVRSSATAEDLPEASFACQLESFLNVRGEDDLLGAIKRCLASLFTNRAIAYRINNNFDHMSIALSVGVQHMIRSDLAGAGVMFSIDTETGFPNAALITAAWGLGETVVQGIVEPDEYHVFKPLLAQDGFRPIIHKALGSKRQKLVCPEGGAGAQTALTATTVAERESWVLNDDEVLQLARWATAIERHYGRPMDIEWAKDGKTGKLYIVQARPETVQADRSTNEFCSYRVSKLGERLATGLAIGDKAAVGTVCRLNSPAEIDAFEVGTVLVTDITDPDWVPIMKQTRAIVTNHGGRTSHAAIVSRELGLPAIVGTGNATEQLRPGQLVTVSCCEGDEGHVYEGAAAIEVQTVNVAQLPKTRTRVMLNLADPATAYRWWRLPSDGVGLARLEFIVAHLIKVHPMALVHFDAIKEGSIKTEIELLCRGFRTKQDYFVENLAMGIARIAAAQHPRPAIVRLSDFKTNEYARLIGGAAFEPHEENPMIGWRGVSRYYSPGYRDGFALECRAINVVRNRIGLINVIVMVPFCRTLAEADKVLAVLAENGLKRGDSGLKIFMMVEIPANVILAEEFAQRFDGFSIGSNDLTQLVLGIDRDSALLADLFDEENEAVTRAISEVLAKARSCGTHTGLCGQAPSDRPEFARFLVGEGIDSISVSPDSFFRVKEVVAAAEAGDTETAISADHGAAVS